MALKTLICVCFNNSFKLGNFAFSYLYKHGGYAFGDTVYYVVGLQILHHNFTLTQTSLPISPPCLGTAILIQ